jgi:hypothetical protein
MYREKSDLLDMYLAKNLPKKLKLAAVSCRNENMKKPVQERQHWLNQ